MKFLKNQILLIWEKFHILERQVEGILLEEVKKEEE